MKPLAYASWLIVLVLAEPVWGGSALTELEATHELVLADVKVPRNVPGSLVFKPCAECATTSLRVTKLTQFFLGEQALPHAEFVAEIDRLRRRSGADQSAGVFVFFDRSTGAINRLILEGFPIR